MNTETESEAYISGREEGLAGALDCDNPFKIGTDEAMEWEDGRAAGEEMQ